MKKTVVAGCTAVAGLVVLSAVFVYGQAPNASAAAQRAVLDTFKDAMRDFYERASPIIRPLGGG